MTNKSVLRRLLGFVDAAMSWWKLDPRRRARVRRMIEQDRRERERPADAPDPSGIVMLEREDLRGMEIAALIERFKALAVARDGADGLPGLDRLYWQLDGVVRELESRDGDARHALLSLYTDPDVRIRAEAAEATLTLAPKLARDRLLAIDDPDWSVPADGTLPRGKLQMLTTTALAERFVALALEQDDALLKVQIPRFGRLYHLLDAIERELKVREGDQRRELVALLGHANPQVRLRAAIATLAVAPDAARRTLQQIVEHDDYPQAVDARGILQSLQEGRYRPD